MGGRRGQDSDLRVSLRRASDVPEKPASPWGERGVANRERPHQATEMDYFFQKKKFKCAFGLDFTWCPLPLPPCSFQRVMSSEHSRCGIFYSIQDAIFRGSGSLYDRKGRRRNEGGFAV